MSRKSILLSAMAGSLMLLPGLALAQTNGAITHANPLGEYDDVEPLQFGNALSLFYGHSSTDDFTQWGLGTKVSYAPKFERELAYVRTIDFDTYGATGFFYIPGTETALRLNYTKGEGSGSNGFSATAGGAFDYGITYLYPENTGSGTSNGVGLGNSFDVLAGVRQDIDFDSISVQLNPDGWHFDCPWFDDWDSKVGLRLDFTNIEDRGDAFSTFSYVGGSINNDMAYGIDTERLALSVTYNAHRRLSSAPIDLFINGAVGYTANNTDGYIWQGTDCPLCPAAEQMVEQRVDYNSNEGGFTGEAGVGASYNFGQGFSIAVGYQYNYVGERPVAIVPVSPSGNVGTTTSGVPDLPGQPARFEQSEVSLSSYYVSFGKAF